MMKSGHCRLADLPTCPTLNRHAEICFVPNDEVRSKKVICQCILLYWISLLLFPSSLAYNIFLGTIPWMLISTHKVWTCLDISRRLVSGNCNLQQLTFFPI